MTELTELAELGGWIDVVGVERHLLISNTKSRLWLMYWFLSDSSEECFKLIEDLDFPMAGGGRLHIRDCQFDLVG